MEGWGREKGKKEGRKKGMEGGRQGGRGGRKGGRKEGREGGLEGTREGGREGERKRGIMNATCRTCECAMSLTLICVFDTRYTNISCACMKNVSNMCLRMTCDMSHI